MQMTMSISEILLGTILYIHLYTYVYTYTYIYIYIYTYTCTYVYTCVHIHTYTNVYINVVSWLSVQFTTRGMHVSIFYSCSVCCSVTQRVLQCVAVQFTISIGEIHVDVFLLCVW